MLLWSLMSLSSKVRVNSDNRKLMWTKLRYLTSLIRENEDEKLLIPSSQTVKGEKNCKKLCWKDICENLLTHL